MELMVVIVVIGVLVGVAIPSYQRYAVRARMSNALTVVQGYQRTVEQWVASGAVIGPCNSTPSPHTITALGPFATQGSIGPYINGLTYNHNCLIEVFMNTNALFPNNTLNGTLSLFMVPYSVNNGQKVTWVCQCYSGGPGWEAYVPSNCVPPSGVCMTSGTVTPPQQCSNDVVLDINGQIATPCTAQ